MAYADFIAWIEKIGAIAVATIVTWLAWPQLQRIRKNAMVDLLAELEEVKQRLDVISARLEKLASKHGSDISALNLRLAVIEDRDSRE